MQNDNYATRSWMTDGVKILLIWNGIFFLLQQLFRNGLGFLDWEPLVRVRLHGFLQTIPYSISGLEELLGLVPALVWQKFLLWQPITYMFLHAPNHVWHILFNMFALWMFGGEIERLWGTTRFLKFYFFTGIGAGLLSVVLQPFSPIPTIGASGAVYGLLLAYAYFFPHRRILIYFLFPVPARLFVIIIGLLAFLNSWNTSSGVANIAHLGGLIFGWIYIKGGSFTGRLRGGGRGSRRVIDFRTEDQDWWRR